LGALEANTMFVNMEPVKVDLVLSAPAFRSNEAHVLPVGHTLRRAACFKLPRAATAATEVDQQAVAQHARRNDTMQIDGIFTPPGLPPPPGVPSHGSLLHGTGRCKPCVWFWRSSGCSNGEDCGHCHLCPQSEIGERRRRRRQVMKQKPYMAAMSDDDTNAGSDLESLKSFDSGSRQRLMPNLC